MRVLATCVPQAGHLRPMVPLLRSLVSRGDDVVVAAGADVRSEVERAGARFAPAGGGFEAWFGQLAARTRGRPGDGLAPDRIAHYFVPRLFCEVVAVDVIDELLRVGQELRPDVVLFDAYSFAGPLAAQLLGAAPVNHLFGPQPDPDVMQLAADAMSPVWRDLDVDVPPDAGMYDGDTVAICPPTLDTAVPPRGRRHLLRPVPLPARSRSSSTPETVYFSLGTMWADAAVVQTVLDALADLPLRVVATLGNLDAAQLSAPSRVELHTFVPQEEILPDASLVIHHAGAGTMFGALAHGLPQLALPQAADNFVNAQMLADAGPGIVLMPGEVTPAAVRHAVERLLDEPGFAHSAQAIAAEIASMPGPDEVATALAL